MQIDDAAPSTIIKEDYVRNVAKINDNARIRTLVIPTEYQSHVEQPMDTEEVIELVPENGIAHTKFTTAVNHEEELTAGIVEQEGARVEKSRSTELMDKCILQLVSFKPGNDVCSISCFFIQFPASRRNYAGL